MELTTVWFVLIAGLWVGYLFLEGFDFGVGVLLPVLGRDDRERRVLINTIGPVWDGNEVWLVVAIAAMFAAFPDWYATVLSGFYLPILLLLVALIVRALAFEYRGKGSTAAWRRNWDRCLVAGSLVPPLVWGAVFANLVRGLPIDADGEFTGSLWSLFNPYALFGAATVLGLCVLHGAVFLTLKTHGEIRDRAKALALRLALGVGVPAAGFLLVTQFGHGRPATWWPVGAALLALVAAAGLLRTGRGLPPFLATGAAIVALVVTVFAALYPAVVPSTTADTFSLTVEGAASAPYTLRMLSWIGAVFAPVVLLYQGWTYWVFRRRIGLSDIP